MAGHPVGDGCTPAVHMVGLRLHGQLGDINVGRALRKATAAVDTQVHDPAAHRIMEGLIGDRTADQCAQDIGLCPG